MLRSVAALFCLAFLAHPPAAVAESAVEGASRNCAADADVQQLAGPAREVFMTRCEAGRTPPIAASPNAPRSPDDAAAVCNARAIGDKMTGGARQNYVDECVKKAQAADAPPAGQER